jgi:predicted molibdopterin-dependent oxidoreductase YjgC
LQPRLTGVEWAAQRLLPAKTGPTNEGRLCIKAWNVHEFVHHKDRLTKPLMRQGGSLQETTFGVA